MKQYIKDHPWVLRLIMFICLVVFIGALAMAYLMGGMSNS